jgi:RimJ/RimL family protein N-acetyltransferase
MEIFATARLTAERLNTDHLPDLIELHLDAEVSKYLGGVRKPDATRSYLNTNLAHWDKHGFGLWAIRTQDGEFVGRAGIRHVVLDDVDEIEIAYTFKRASWGQGFASEITAELLQIAWTTLDLPHIIGFASVENLPSRRVLEKAGFGLDRTTTYHNEAVVVYRLERPKAV